MLTIIVVINFKRWFKSPLAATCNISVMSLSNSYHSPLLLAEGLLILFLGVIPGEWVTRVWRSEVLCDASWPHSPSVLPGLWPVRCFCFSHSRHFIRPHGFLHLLVIHCTLPVVNVDSILIGISSSPTPARDLLEVCYVIISRSWFWVLVECVREAANLPSHEIRLSELSTVFPIVRT